MQCHGRAFVLRILVASASNVRLGLSKPIQPHSCRMNPRGAVGPRGVVEAFLVFLRMQRTLREHALKIEGIVTDARTAPSTGQELSTKQLLLAGCCLGGREGKFRKFRDRRNVPAR